EYYTESLWDARQIYLRIRKGRLSFIICASQLGNNYFVSWWFGERVSMARDFWPRGPFFGKAISNMLLNQNFYQADVDSMFKSLSQHRVNEVIKGLCEQKGIRGLTDKELKYINIPLTKRMYWELHQNS